MEFVDTFFSSGKFTDYESSNGSEPFSFEHNSINS